MHQIHAGMGAILHDRGVSFRVWAPHAKSVRVIGSFNDWKPDALPMLPEENGYWAVDTPDAKPGDEYRFAIDTGEEMLNRIDPYAKQVTNSVGNAVVYQDNFDWGQDHFVCAALNELVIYELHVGSFAKSGVEKPGTLDSARERLGYLAQLGINAVELMPVQEFAGDLSWGYNPSHPFAVEGAYGGPDALKRFIQAAHEHGIAVILDVVYNHFGPSDLDLWRFDSWHEGEGGGIYFYNDWRAETPWGATRPDYGRPEVRQYLHDNAMMWLREYRADGLRYDATVYIRKVNGAADPTGDLPDGWSLVQWINQTVRDQFPGKVLIAEDLQNNEYLTKATAEGGAGFHAQWTANFVHPLRQILTTPLDEHRSMQSLVDLLSATFNGDPFQKLIYSESHDEVANGKARVVQEVDPANPESWYARKRATLGSAITLIAPGTPMLFQGQEFLTPGWFEDSDPLDWSRAERFSGIVALHRDLIHHRLNRSGKTRGLTGSHLEVTLLNEEQKLLSAIRRHTGGAGDDTVIVLNASANGAVGVELRFPSPGLWRLRLSSAAMIYDPDFGGQVRDVEAGETARVNVPPYALLIFSQD
ncbi:alpha-amylase family glycosyl hydrolase [Bryobacter aggregatus]|uniref:alpha-amylase family glycosyl hydrolase n=1 Tax=Bryobacter aggregatus TaxID=360054 RepID=UPI0004E0EED5|nr:alpha-amylase family glycosyl hydrolase [Bryobacter aggregatus]